MNITGRVNDQIGLVFAAHDSGSGKIVDASCLGEIMSLPARQQPGRRIEQSVDPVIPQALEKALVGEGILERGTPLVVDVPASSMFSLSVDIRPDRFNWHKRPCAVYDYAIYHSDQTFKTVKVPDDLIAALEFRPVGGSFEDVLYDDALILIDFVWRALDAAQIATAGGHIVPMLITSEGAIFPTGDLGRIEGDAIVRKGGIRVNKDGKITYTLGDDVEQMYRTRRPSYRVGCCLTS